MNKLIGILQLNIPGSGVNHSLVLVRKPPTGNLLTMQFKSTPEVHGGWRSIETQRAYTHYGSFKLEFIYE